MYASFSRLLGIISVRETDSHIIVSGIPGLYFSKDIYNVWKTNKISNNLFSSVSRNAVKLPKFYAIELLYILEQLDSSRRTFTGRRILSRIKEMLLENTWLNTIGADDFKSRIDLNQLNDLTVVPFPHQMNFIKHYDAKTFHYKLRGLLMDVAAGGGKTISHYALAHCLKADTKIFIVPKNSVYDVWEKTIKSLFKKGPPNYWHSLSGVAPEPGLEYYIVHYDYMLKFVEFVKTNKRRFGQVYVGIDESHNFNETSERTNLLIDIVKLTDARDVVHASGTPFKAIGSEAITLLKTICSDFTPEVEVGFRKLWGKEAKRAIEILANRIGIVSYKVAKAAIETPGVEYKEHKIRIKNGHEYTLTAVRDKMKAFITERKALYTKQMPEHERLYGICMDLHKATLKTSKDHEAFSLYKSYIKTLRKGYDASTMKDVVMYCNRYELKTIIPSLPERYRKSFMNVRAIIKYVDLKVMGEALSQVLGRMRIQCHLDMLPHMGIDTIVDNAITKTVVYTSYVEVVKELGDMTGRAGYKPTLVYGETNKDLTNIIKAFEFNPDVNPLIATFKSLSTAVPLTMANTIIFTNAPFREYERTQTIARVDRIGQKHLCFIHEVYLDTGEEDNISTRSKDIMAWSREQVESILGVSAPSDLETSLEALVEHADVISFESGEDWLDALKQTYPIIDIEQD